jgi:hypothetical protein
VEATTLDSMIQRYGVPNFCKIDVEGFELDVLRGLSEPLPIISFEYHTIEVARLIGCLDHLVGLSKIKINFIRMDGSGFILPEWIEPKDLDLSVLPSEGDCFVMSNHR